MLNTNENGGGHGNVDCESGGGRGGGASGGRSVGKGVTWVWAMPRSVHLAKMPVPCRIELPPWKALKEEGYI